MIGQAGGGDVDLGGAGRDGDGDEAVFAGLTGGDGGVVEVEGPSGVVAAVEDEGLGDGGCDGEVLRGGAGLGVGGGGGDGVEGEPVGRVGEGEGVVVGGDGGVLVGGFGAGGGVELGHAGWDGVFFVAGLVEEAIGRVGEGCDEGESDGGGEGGAEFDGAEGESEGKA